MAMAVYDHVVILQYRSTIIQYLKKIRAGTRPGKEDIDTRADVRIDIPEDIWRLSRRSADSCLAAPMDFTDVPQCGIFQRIAREGEIYEKTRPYSDNCRASGRSRYRLVLCGTGKNHGSADWRRFRALVSLPYMRE